MVGSSLNYIIPNPQQVFVYVYSASVLPGMVPWFVVLVSQLRFRQVPCAPVHAATSAKDSITASCRSIVVATTL